MRIAHVHDYRLESSEPIESEELEVDIEPFDYSDDLDIFDDEKEYFHFIIRLKYYIRKSFEYTQLMKFLKKKRGLYCCGVHPNITTWDGFSINIHHTPLVLEDIINIIIAKRKSCHESLKMSAIAKEVMMLHYMGLVGLYPLCETCHEYAHGDTNDLFIPLDSIFGDPAKFFDIYEDFISDALRDKFKSIKSINKGYAMIERDVPPKLVKKYIYIKSKGQEMISVKALTGFLNQLSGD